MPELVFHGDEEAIERAADEFYPIMEEHTSHTSGRIAQNGLVDRQVDAARWRLIATDLDPSDIELGRQYAVQTVKFYIRNLRDESIMEQTSDFEI